MPPAPEIPLESIVPRVISRVACTLIFPPLAAPEEFISPVTIVPGVPRLVRFIVPPLAVLELASILPVVKEFGAETEIEPAPAVPEELILPAVTVVPDRDIAPPVAPAPEESIFSAVTVVPDRDIAPPVAPEESIFSAVTVAPDKDIAPPVAPAPEELIFPAVTVEPDKDIPPSAAILLAVSSL